VKALTVLSPLQAIDNPSTSELLHRIYVHLAGSKPDPQDLNICLADLRLGLKQASLANLTLGSSSRKDYALANGKGTAAAKGLMAHRTDHNRKSELNRTGVGNGGGTSVGQRSGNSFRAASSCSSPASAVGCGSQGVRVLRQSSSNSRHWCDGAVLQCNSSSGSSPGCSSPSNKGSCKGNAVNSSSGAVQGGSSRTWPEYHVPLARVAAFLRQAGLVPRLFTKYVTQLQRMAEDLEKGSGSRLAGRVPVMPSLHATLGPRMSQSSGYKLQQKGAAHRRRRWAESRVVSPSLGCLGGLLGCREYAICHAALYCYLVVACTWLVCCYPMSCILLA
jgi:hypothetical protein